MRNEIFTGCFNQLECCKDKNQLVIRENFRSVNFAAYVVEDVFFKTQKMLTY